MDTAATTTLRSLWNQTLSCLRPRLAAEEFDNWIRPMEPVAFSGQRLELSVPNRLFASWVQENYLDVLASAWVETCGRQAAFTFTWDGQTRQGELFQDLSRAKTTLEAEPARQRSNGLMERYVFDTFVVGASNQFAHAASVAVARQPGTLYNPFFLYGGVGLGKTHLANAIGRAILDATPQSRVLFLSAEGFANQLIEAIARNKTPAFKNRMRRIDVLILDDVQFLANRERTQEEFFHLFNALYEAGRQIILTSDKFPNELRGVEERLCNRFGWGLVADINAPDLETRVAILQRKAQTEGVDLPMEVGAFIAETVDSNIRDLEGALTRVCAYASLNKRQVTLALAEELLAGVTPDGRRRVGLEEIAAAVAQHFGVKHADLSARKRTKKVAEARQVAMYVMRQQIGASFPAIGAHLGGRDHSTVIHACQAVERRLRNEPGFRRLLEGVMKAIGCG